jgi:hypothetical protein
LTLYSYLFNVLKYWAKLKTPNLVIFNIPKVSIIILKKDKVSNGWLSLNLELVSEFQTRYGPGQYLEIFN